MLELRTNHPDNARLIDLQYELAAAAQQSRQRIHDLETQLARAAGLSAELESKCRELAQCVEYLHAAERTIDERTAWAQRNAAEADALRDRLQTLRSNLWVRFAATLGLLR